MINSIKLEELERFNELGFLVNRNFSNLFVLKDIIDSEYDELFGFYEDSKLVGFIHIVKIYETVDIVNVVVDEFYRNHGIASRMLNHVIGLYDDVNNIMLEVNENNNAAVSLYLKHGFDIINKRKNYYGSEDAIIMKRVVENERC